SIADESTHELCRDEVRGRRVFGEDVEDLFAVPFAARLDDMSQHDFLPVVVPAWIEREASALPRPIDRPAGERARHFRYVMLCVAAVDAERVQLHQFAPVVLVEA